MIKENNEENNIFEVKEDENYELNINYLDENPFSYFIDRGISRFAFGLGQSALGIGMLFFVEATSPLLFDILTGAILYGGATIFSLGLALGILGIIGTLKFKWFKSYKEGKCKEFYEKLGTSEEMKEEREIYIEAISKINSYFLKYVKLDENKIKEIANLILEKYNSLEEDWIKNKIEEYKEKYSNLSKFNILVIGKTGVGKSCLINGVLNLKNNKAEEGENEIPQKINGWKKKYPIDDNDSDIKGLNLWDSEGIEFSKKNNNNIEHHQKKIYNIIKENMSIPNNQINCLWFCINGNRLEDEDKNYINLLLNTYDEKKIIGNLKSIYTNYKFPIIFIYTQAYQSEENNINIMKEALKKIEFFNSHSDDLIYIDVIAKEKSYTNRRTKKIETEPKYNIKKLIEQSLELGKKGMALPLLLHSNKLYKELNDKAKNMVEKLQQISIELTKKILGSEKKGKKEIFDEAIPIFKRLIKNLCQEKIDNNSENEINNHIDSIIEIMTKISDDQLDVALNSFNKRKYIESFNILLHQKYIQKKNKNLKEIDFNDNCNDFIIGPNADNYVKYGILSLFSYIKTILFDYFLNEHNKILKNKKERIKKIFEKYSEENYQRFIKNSNIDKYKE